MSPSASIRLPAPLLWPPAARRVLVASRSNSARALQWQAAHYQLADTHATRQDRPTTGKQRTTDTSQADRGGEAFGDAPAVSLGNSVQCNQ